MDPIELTDKQYGHLAVLHERYTQAAQTARFQRVLYEQAAKNAEEHNNSEMEFVRMLQPEGAPPLQKYRIAKDGERILLFPADDKKE